MKKIALLVIIGFCSSFVCAQNTPAEDEYQKRLDTIQYGLETEVIDLLTLLIREKSEEFSDTFYEEFEKTKNPLVRDKIIEYFLSVKDDRLKEYTVNALADLTDYRRSTSVLILKYVQDLHITEAVPAVTALIQNENEDYLDQAIAVLGKIGGKEEAVFLTEFFDRTLTIPTQQAVVKALGELQAVETWEKLIEIAKDSNKNSYLRSVAAEAIGNMKKQESIDELVLLFEDTDPNIRSAVVKGLSNFNTEKSHNVIISAFKDNQVRVRFEAVNATQILQLNAAIPSLLYRAKNDTDASLRYKCFEVLASMKSKEGIDYLVSVVENKKANPVNRSKAATYLLEYDFNAGIDAVKTAARESLQNDYLKNLRYDLGKEFAKYENAALADICSEYLAHKDALTVGTGLDIYAKNRFANVTSLVEALANTKKTNGITAKAKNILEKK